MVNTSATVNDYAPATQGQVKWLALQAYGELGAWIGNPGSTLSQFITGLSLTNGNYAPVTVGQVKAASKPFYDRLRTEWGSAQAFPYPWEGASVAPNDYAAANIGQVKHAFAFQLWAPARLYSVGTPTPDSATVDLGQMPRDRWYRFNGAPPQPLPLQGFLALSEAVLDGSSNTLEILQSGAPTASVCQRLSWKQYSGLSAFLVSPETGLLKPVPGPYVAYTTLTNTDIFAQWDQFSLSGSPDTFTGWAWNGTVSVTCGQSTTSCCSPAMRWDLTDFLWSGGSRTGQVSVTWQQAKATPASRTPPLYLIRWRPTMDVGAPSIHSE